MVPANRDTKLYGSPIHNLQNVDPGPLITCLASCHSLTIIEGNIIGDPLDQKMFDATDWVLEEPAVDDTSKFDLLAPTVVRPKRHTEIDADGLIGDEVGILRQFPFSSSLQRMSVVARDLKGSEFVVYSKGTYRLNMLCLHYYLQQYRSILIV